MAAIDADESQSPPAQIDELLRIKLRRIAFINNKTVKVRVMLQVLLETLQVPCARMVDVELLVREEVDGHCTLSRIAKEVKQYEESSVMHPYLCNSTRYTRLSLFLREADDSLNRSWQDPTFDQLISVPCICIQFSHFHVSKHIAGYSG